MKFINQLTVNYAKILKLIVLQNGTNKYVSQIASASQNNILDKLKSNAYCNIRICIFRQTLVFSKECEIATFYANSNIETDFFRK